MRRHSDDGGLIFPVRTRGHILMLLWHLLHLKRAIGELRVQRMVEVVVLVVVVVRRHPVQNWVISLQRLLLESLLGVGLRLHLLLCEHGLVLSMLDRHLLVVASHITTATHDSLHRGLPDVGLGLVGGTLLRNHLELVFGQKVLIRDCGLTEHGQSGLTRATFWLVLDGHILNESL